MNITGRKRALGPADVPICAELKLRAPAESQREEMVGEI